MPNTNLLIYIFHTIKYAECVYSEVYTGQVLKGLIQNI